MWFLYTTSFLVQEVYWEYVWEVWLPMFFYNTYDSLSPVHWKTHTIPSVKAELRVKVDEYTEYFFDVSSKIIKVNDCVKNVSTYGD